MMVVLVAFAIIITIILIKYKAMYQVYIEGEFVGYIQNKDEFEKLIQDEIINKQGENIAFTDVTITPTYEITLADVDTTNESEIFQRIEETAVTTYRVYAIEINGEDKDYVSSREDAETAVEQLKLEYADKLEQLDIAVQEIYTQNLEELGTVELETAVASLDAELTIQVQYEQEKAAATLDGVYFSVKPVTGTITSRFGANESIRDHTHMGIDIAAPNGTPIQAAADGTVSFAGWYGGYGNLVIIDHENGIQTYYGHCSKLYVTEGTTVTAGDTIAAVGSTGESTGNHLHFEIRKNGTQINPQKYLYK